uniref:Disease resistance protein RPM1-like n=1 Tax=Populus alba TaxID=43335 RepID=A0A4U5PV92_POPAL|nr:uncharacterized protein D5086_0000177570 [Populus alba]
MAEGSVNLLLSKLAQILEEEGQLLTGIRTEAEYISDELEFMKAFLRVADAMEERDPRLEVLVKKVRDIAYETEDALDDFKLRLTRDRGQRFFAPLLRGFDYSVNLRARHQIASRIRAIKSRVIGISEAHRRYLIRNNIMGQGSTFSSISRLESQGDGLLLEEADLVGIEKPKRQLIEWLLERKSGREVVSVVGMGGLGKSTLVKKVYDDPDVKKQFKFRAWITVSQSFKKEELLKDIIQQLFRVHKKPGPKGVDSMDYDKLRTSVSETILGRCEGLPLAIVSISGVLAAKDKNKIDEWEMVHRSLGAGFESNDTLMSTRKILSLSYSDLPYYLKSCLLYFSIFPAGNPIERMKLIRLWIAEGFVEGKEGMTLEEVADDYLNELIKRSLVRVVEATSDGRVKTCRIHDLLREIMITKAKDQDFVAIVKEEGMMWSEKVRRVSIHKAVPSIQRRHVASRLRSVLIFWGADSFPDSPAPSLSFGHLRLLNVLDLEGAPLKEFPSKVSSLFLLKYLSLRNTNVNSIPSSISKLLNLETLDLKQTQISGLPVGILKLRKLRHLLVYRYEIDSDDRIHTKYGFQPPPQIGRLQSLQKLCFVDANQGGDLLLELGRLNQLRRLGIVKFRKEHGKDLCSSVTKLTDLRALSITSITDSEFIDVEYLSNPPRFLQRLYLTGRLHSLPEWLHSLDSLVVLVLKWSRLSDDPLLSLQHLPNLVHLELVQVYDGEMLCFQAKGFQRLKFLGINKLESLRVITVQQGAMPCLEKLIVQSCKEMKRVPSGIEHLTTLKVLEFFNMPKELIMTLQPCEENGDYLKVAHVPDVYSTYWNNGILDNFTLLTKEDGSPAQSSPSGSRRDHIWK